jgi:hypothetical protein
MRPVPTTSKATAQPMAALPQASSAVVPTTSTAAAERTPSGICALRD